MLLFLLGVLVGALVALRLMARRPASQREQERQAVARAEARLRALEAAALRELADVGQLVPRQPLAPVSRAGSADVVGAHAAGPRFEVRWHRVRVPGSACSGLLAELVPSGRVDGLRQKTAPGWSS